MYKKIKNELIKLVLFAGLLFAGACETGQLEILDNPNAISPAQSDIDFFLNNIQNGVMVMFEGTPLNTFGLSEAGQEVTRMMVMFGPTYQGAYTGTSLDNTWRSVYSTALPDIRTMTPLAEEQELFTHVAIAKVLEAYMMICMVDFFGDVPYSEATQGIEFPNPKVDSGADIYAAVEVLLDEAIADFQKDEQALPANDLFYGADEGKWVKFANTLKLKMYLQTRLVDNSVAAKINAIIASGNFITISSEDFEIKWSATDTNPDSRHPEFGPNFDSGTAEYMNSTYMYWLADEKNIRDPRIRYYFYRQVNETTTDVNEQPCITQNPPAHFGPDDIFCNFSNEGYWGRVHGDASGIPPDRGKRAAYGLYPVGGLFDDDSFKTITDRNIGTKGAGISPIMLASFVDFMLAEASLTLGTTGDARTYLESGVRKSIDKVMNFSPENVDSDFAPSTEDVEDYVSEVLSLYDSAATESDKLGVIAKEYFIALWGNGVEAYNTYRRTGKPDLQQTLIASPGPFIRSFFYPQVFADQNATVQQKADQDVQVFWDSNPAGFID